MMKQGSFAVAVVDRQVVIVQAARTHTKRERFLDVLPYTPFGGSRIFLSLSGTNVVRVPTSSILSPLSSSSRSSSGYIDSDTESDYDSDSHYSNLKTRMDVAIGEGTIELPESAFQEYVRLSEQHYNRPRSASRSAKLWTSLVRGRANSVRH
ncbi:hypothetical protein FA13DRAFT_689520 [Coprinellus micaceus]|uniref:Uncharacterized protein n=1 Tax=Coprinellus micaceus TaxID=71717 RepID=A0A4Y7T4P1_COPMI|nr:hypothetical protein FA13DRAFT_689520 [Coprinellus micaceus]